MPVIDYVDAHRATPPASPFVFETMATDDTVRTLVRQASSAEWALPVSWYYNYTWLSSKLGTQLLTRSPETDIGPTGLSIQFRGDSFQIVVPYAPTDVYGRHRLGPIADFAGWMAGFFSRAEGDSEEDSTVARTAEEAKRSSGLTDDQLARLFPERVTREHYNRWRNGQEKRPTPGNLRRLELLRRLFARLAESAIEDRRNWLLLPLEGEDQSPYDLLETGRFSQVEEMVARLPRTAEELAVYRPVRLKANAPWDAKSLIVTGLEDDDEDDGLLVAFDDEE